MKKIISILLALMMLISAASVFCMNAYAKETKPEDEILGSDIVEYAEKFLGKPYRYAAKGPNAFDCSGFVYYVFSHFGYRMPCSSRAYWAAPSSIGKVVGVSSLKKAQKGDIISWRGHVAIYIGKGRCIEALNHRHGVTERLGVYAHAAGNGRTFRVIRMKNVVRKKTAPKEISTIDMLHIPKASTQATMMANSGDMGFLNSLPLQKVVEQ